MPKRTRDYHAWLLKQLAEPREAERYLKIAMADSPAMFLKALRNVAEANRMARVAEDAGVSRESLYRTLSEEGNPRFDTLNCVLDALGMNLTVSLKTTISHSPTPSPNGSFTTATSGTSIIIETAGTPTTVSVKTNSENYYFISPEIKGQMQLSIAPITNKYQPLAA